MFEGALSTAFAKCARAPVDVALDGQDDADVVLAQGVGGSGANRIVEVAQRAVPIAERRVGDAEVVGGLDVRSVDGQRRWSTVTASRPRASGIAAMTYG